MKPRPTEYRGVRFRSKNEAQIARLLDLRGKPFGCVHNWFYEPKFLTVDNYTPDFIYHETEFDENGIVFSDSWHVVECKPSKATDTYRRELADRFAAVAETPFIQAIKSAFGPVQFELWEGSVYSGHKNTWLFVGYDDQIPECITQPFDESLIGPWIDDADREAIGRYRFDLVDNRIPCSR